jgi:hypothetical protein
MKVLIFIFIFIVIFIGLMVWPATMKAHRNVKAPPVCKSVVDRHSYLHIYRGMSLTQHVHDPECSQCSQGISAERAGDPGEEIEHPPYVRLQIDGHDFLFIGNRSYVHDPECVKCAAATDRKKQ